MSFQEDAAKFMGSNATVADKIRALDAAGHSRAEIARMLGKRYQHVRNVLEGDKLKTSAPKPTPAPQGRVRPAADGIRVGNFFRLPIEPGGLVRLPADVMEALGLREGGLLMADLEGERFVVISPKESMRRAKAKVPPWRPGEPMWSEELIAERRREAAKEESDG